MKIIHIVSYFSTIWKYQENYLAQEQVLDGHEVHVFTSNLNFPYPDYERTAAPVLGPRQKKSGSLEVTGFHLHQLPVLFEFSNRVFLKGLISKITRLNPDVIYCHGITQPYSIRLLYCSKLSHIPIVCDEHVLYSDVAGSPFRRLFYKLTGWLFKKRMQQRVLRYVGISDGVGKLFQSLVGLPASIIQIIPLGSDTRLFSPDPEQGMAFRKSIEIPQDALLVGYTGKIGDYKKVHYLIDAANQFPHYNIYILLVGNVLKEYASILQEKIACSAARVVLLDAIPEAGLPSVYNACDFLAWPAHQTISTVNASSCGKPIICSDFLKERYQNGQGIGVIPSCFPSFLKAFQYLAENKTARENMGIAGRQWVLNEVSWRAIHLQFMHIHTPAYGADSFWIGPNSSN